MAWVRRPYSSRFIGIYYDRIPAGRTTAYQWYSNGCRTLDDVREGKNGVKLSPVMEIGLKFYDGARLYFLLTLRLKTRRY